MKILQVVSTPPLAWTTGGCARVTYEISKALVKQGHYVTILTTDMMYPNQRYSVKSYPEIIDGINIFRFRYISDWLAWKHKIYIAPNSWNYLKNHLKEFDLIHLQDILSIQAIFTHFYSKKFGIPYIMTTHGSVKWLLQNRTINRLIFKIIAKKILLDSKYITALTISEKEMLKDIGIEENKIDIIPNGINIKEFQDLPRKGLFRNLYGIPPNDKMILYLGRIHSSKGIDLLIRSFSIVNKKNKETKLVICGPDDGYRYYLDKIIKALGLEKNIIFTGFINENNKIQALIDADVFVSPAFSGFPLTFLESCICGTPIITTIKGDKMDWIDNQTGFIVDYDEEKLSEAIIKIISDISIARKFSEKCKCISKVTFDWDKIVDNLIRTYEKTLRIQK